MPVNKELVRNAIDKSKQALMSAKLNMDYNLLSDAENRIYYSYYYAVLALAFMENFASTNHRELIRWFNKKFIHEENMFTVDIYISYKIAFKEYRKFDNILIQYPLKENTVKNYDAARDFVETIEKFIQQKIS
jgi:uncharacterized protein (UPF0332 family)